MKSWVDVKAMIDEKIDQIWIDEPDEIKLIRWGIIRGGAGTGNQYFSTMCLLETYTLLLGQRYLYPFLLMADKDSFTLENIKEITRTCIKDSFNPTVFLGDLGLHDIKEIGAAYIEVLDSLETKKDYIELTSAYMTYCTRMHRWVHYIFPWNIGLGAFPQRSPKEMQEIMAIAERFA